MNVKSLNIRKTNSMAFDRNDRVRPFEGCLAKGRPLKVKKEEFRLALS